MLASVIRFYGFTDAAVMAMPYIRFFAYAKQIRALRAEERSGLIEATSFPHMDKQGRKQAQRRLTAELGIERRRKTPRRKLRMVGDMPADVAALQALGRQPGSVDLSGLVQVVRKADKQSVKAD